MGRPSFKLRVAQDTHNIPQGARRVFRVVAERQNYQGPIRLSFTDLPAGVTASGTGIAAGNNSALITLTAAGQLQGSTVATLRGTSVGVDPPISATAVFERHPLRAIQPWLQSDFALALAPPHSVPFRIEWGLPHAQAPLVLGSTVKESVKIVRPPRGIGPVRLSLVTSEMPPVINGKPAPDRVVGAVKASVAIPVDAQAKAALAALDSAAKVLATAEARARTTDKAGQEAVAKTQAEVAVAEDHQAAVEQKMALARLRHETALAELEKAQVELAAAKKSLSTANETVAAAENGLANSQRALAKAAARAQAETAAAVAAVHEFAAAQTTAVKTLAEAEANIKNEIDFNVIVPATLVATSQDLAIKAELRSLDGKTVLAEAYTPVRRFVPLNPLAIRLPGDPTFVIKLNPDAPTVMKLAGTVERLAGFAGDVTVSIAGQPKTVSADKFVLKPQTNDFELKLEFPNGFPPSELKTIRVIASGPPDPKAANIVVRTEIPIVIRLLSARVQE